MSDFSFMKSGSSLVNDPTQLSEEEIAAIASPVILYTKKALEICDIYVSHCGRIFVQPEDVLRCLQYTAFDFNDILSSEDGKSELCESYREILGHMNADDIPFSIDDNYNDDNDNEDNEDGCAYHDEDTVSQEHLKQTFKKTIEKLFPIFRYNGKECNEAAALALQLASRGMEADTKNEFCESQCPCSLCEKVNKRHLEWHTWEAKSPQDEHLKRAIDAMCEKIKNGKKFE